MVEINIRRILCPVDFSEVSRHAFDRAVAIARSYHAEITLLHVLPVALTFLRDFPSITLRLLLLDRIVSLVDEGVDLGIRLAPLPDSALRALSAGAVRRAVYASPDYLARHGVPAIPEQLAGHACIVFGSMGATADRWSFGPAQSGPVVAVRPRRQGEGEAT